MKMRKHIFIITLLLFTLMGCTDIFDQVKIERSDEPFPVQEDQLVVFGYVSPDQPTQIYVDRTYPLYSSLRDSFPLPSNVELELLSEGEKIGSFKQVIRRYDDGEIRDQYFENTEANITIGSEYELRIIAEGYDATFGICTVPERVSIDSLSKRLITEGEKEYYLFTLYFTDPSDTENYCMTALQNHTYYIDTNLKDSIYFENPTHYKDTLDRFYIDTLRGARKQVFPIEDPVFAYLPNNQSSIKEPFDISIHKPRVFPDKLFSGRQYALQFKIEREDYTPSLAWNQFPRYRGTEFIKVYLRSISKELFESYKSKYQYEIIEGDIYAEPMKVYSNMSNELGVFGAFTVDSVTIDVWDNLLFLN